MRAEHFQSWVAVATRKKRPETDNGEQVVGIIQIVFRDIRLQTEYAWYTVVLTPKRNKEFRVIRIMEVLRKAVLGVINQRIRMAVKCHDVLHCLWAGQGTRNASLKAKLLQQLTSMREDILYEVFLDLRKAYAVLDRERCMEIFVAYVVNP